MALSKAGEALNWSVGFRNHQGLYLTVESFGDRLNANGKSMKKKQIFFFEQDEGAVDEMYLRTHRGKYLTSKADGTFAADGEGKGPSEVFRLVALDDGHYVLVSAFGYLAGGSGDKLDAFVKCPPGGPEALVLSANIPADRKFIMQLAMHPQVSIKNLNRKTFIHASGDQMTTDEVIPWGADACLTLGFNENGTYSIQANDGRILSSNGQLKATHDSSCEFTLEMRGKKLVAFKDERQKYLTSLGATGLLKATKDSAGPDECFIIEDSHPQIKMTSWQGKKVSVRSSNEVTANQVDTTDAEMFQIEIQDNGKWALRSHKDTFWGVTDDGAVTDGLKSFQEPSAQFDIQWLDAKLALIAANGKYVTVKKNGALVANGSEANEESTFIYELTNRPNLVLRGNDGFVSTMPSGVLECNKSSGEVYKMEVIKGVCQICTEDGKYWKVEEDGSSVSAKGSAPDHFFLEFVSLSKFCVKYYFKDGRMAYLTSNQNGALTVDCNEVKDATTWEY